MNETQKRFVAFLRHLEGMEHCEPFQTLVDNIEQALMDGDEDRTAMLTILVPPSFIHEFMMSEAKKGHCVAFSRN